MPLDLPVLRGLSRQIFAWERRSARTGARAAAEAEVHPGRPVLPPQRNILELPDVIRHGKAWIHGCDFRGKKYVIEISGQLNAIFLIQIS